MAMWIVSSALRGLLLFGLLLALFACQGSLEPRREPLKLMRPRPPEQIARVGAPARERWDFWLRELGAGMSLDEMRAHLEVPAGQRLSARGARLLDLRLRTLWLQRLEGRLSPEQTEAFMALDDAVSARRFLEDLEAAEAHSDGGS